MENLGSILAKLDTFKANRDSDIPQEVEPDPIASCNTCNDKGWLTPKLPTGHPDFGTIKSCECRQNIKQEEMSDRLLSYSNLGSLARYTFETLNADNAKEDIFREAFINCSNYSERPSGWMMINGPHGSGKTHLSAAIANRCISTGKPAFFIYVPDLMDHLRSSYTNSMDFEYDDLFDQVKNAPILILDGIPGNNTSNWAAEKLNQILNHRSNGRLPTVLTTSENLISLDPFVKSRVLDSNLCNLVSTGSKSSIYDENPNLGAIPKNLSKMNFETFNPKGRRGNSNLEPILESAKKYSQNPDGWLTFYSNNSGVGKTHLAIAIANHRQSIGDEVFFAFVPELMDELRAGFSPDNLINSSLMFDRVKESTLLVLDDIGNEQDTDWSQKTIYHLLVYRHNHRLPTVITTRTDFGSIADRSAQASRIQDPNIGQILSIKAPDYRMGRTRNK
ncbi:ATP-binding protein [Chloroflexi bacterium]|nr:ATP-binding protein [Chloroflexota bacterium]